MLHEVRCIVRIQRGESRLDRTFPHMKISGPSHELMKKHSLFFCLTSIVYII